MSWIESVFPGATKADENPDKKTISYKDWKADVYIARADGYREGFDAGARESRKCASFLSELESRFDEISKTMSRLERGIADVRHGNGLEARKATVFRTYAKRVLGEIDWRMSQIEFPEKPKRKAAAKAKPQPRKKGRVA